MEKLKQLTPEQLKVILEEYKKMSYKDLTPSDWDFLTTYGIVNGCGGAGNSVKNRLIRWIIKKVMKRLRITFFRADCNIHDFSYWKGSLAYLTEEELEKIKKISPKAYEILQEDIRKIADMGFFKKMIEDIDLYDSGTIKYTFYALVFYYAVRIGGKSYFNYTK
jgi:hypothetical protein